MSVNGEEMYHQYEFLREFKVEAAAVAPGFDEFAGVIQCTELNITELLDKNQLGEAFIKEIE